MDAYLISTALHHLIKGVAGGHQNSTQLTDRNTILTSYDVSSPDKPVSHASGGISLFLSLLHDKWSTHQSGLFCEALSEELKQ